MHSSIFKFVIQRASIVLGGLALASSLTCWASDAYTDFVSLKIGSASSTTTDLSPSTLNSQLEVDGAPSLTLGYGFQENNWRILLELNQLQRDAQVNPSLASGGKVSSTTLFYNVFWVPTFNYDISVLIGGGLGYSQHKIKDVVVTGGTGDELKDTGWSAKVALGVEYSPITDVGVQLMYENILTDKVQDEKKANWSVSDLDHSELSLGVVYRF